ncbi:MAG: tetratricopeptide repeat protein [Nitrospirae bacterium]|nr:MAG: tetratricopeptide repeat protein [Nitrospirota bacterium]
METVKVPMVQFTYRTLRNSFGRRRRTMQRRLAVLLAVGVVIWLAPEAGAAQSAGAWEQFTEAGKIAYQQSHYGEALAYFQAAVKEAEKFGPEDRRLATSLNNLAAVYSTQDNYKDAEPIYRRALHILEQALGREHPDLATSLNNLAVLYDSQGK